MGIMIACEFSCMGIMIGCEFSCNFKYQIQSEMSEPAKQFLEVTKNYLLERETPALPCEWFYDDETLQKKVFSRVFGAETHSLRRQAILKDHPEIVELLKPSKPYTALLTLLIVPLAISIVYLAKETSWPVYLFSLYVFSSTLNHTLHVLIHDLTHQAALQNPILSRILSIACNIPMAVPSAISFGKYHSDHHNFLGEQKKDPDLPTDFQANLSLRFGQKYNTIHLVMCALIYALRPLIVYPAKPTTWELVNLVVILSTNYLVYHYWGLSTLVYMVVSGFTSIGPHPAAMHIFAEHFETITGMETYDYFGTMNFFNLNLGYHIEHHDFPTCPWYNLPKLRQIAKEYYEYLPHHTSYLEVMRKFLFDKKYNLFHRTVRVNSKEK